MEVEEEGREGGKESEGKEKRRKIINCFSLYNHN